MKFSTFQNLYDPVIWIFSALSWKKWIFSPIFRTSLAVTEGPVIWSRVPETTLAQRQVYRTFIYENVVPVGRVKVNPVWLFITLGEQSNEQIFLFFWVSLGHPIPVCFAELVFTFLIRISALNPKSRHYVTLTTPRTVLGRRAKAFISRKVVPLARVTLPAEVRQLAHPSCLDPRDEFALVEVWKGTS